MHFFSAFIVGDRGTWRDRAKGSRLSMGWVGAFIPIGESPRISHAPRQPSPCAINTSATWTLLVTRCESRSRRSIVGPWLWMTGGGSNWILGLGPGRHIGGRSRTASRIANTANKHTSRMAISPLCGVRCGRVDARRSCSRTGYRRRANAHLAGRGRSWHSLR